MQTGSPNRRLIISCLIILLVVCICLSLVSILLASSIILPGPGSGFSLNPASGPKTATSQVSIDQQIKTIENQVSEIRGLTPESEVDISFLTPEELHQHVLDDFFVDYTVEDAKNEALFYWTFGLLDRDFDLYNFYVDLFSEQIAGFYDTKTKQMYVVQNSKFAGPERLTYAHEFVHALQDQSYDIEKGLRFNEEFCLSDYDRCSAVSALIEGDASLVESYWLSSEATLTDQREIAAFYNNFSSPVYDSAPVFIQEDFIFPYQQGKQFVEHLYALGGWEQVNQAYLEPPSTTEQILHPEKYPGDTPSQVLLPDFSEQLGADWELIEDGTLGEWYTYLVLADGEDTNSRITDSASASAAAGWEGDYFVVYYNAKEDSIFMLLLSQWENPQEAAEFANTFKDYAGRRFGQPVALQGESTYWESPLGIQALWFEGDNTAWCITPDMDRMDAVLPMVIHP